jgi:hypothetical protein
MPMAAVAGCCARAAHARNGEATAAAPPRSVMQSRLEKFIRSPRQSLRPAKTALSALVVATRAYIVVMISNTWMKPS